MCSNSTFIDRVWLKHDLVENIPSNNTLHIFTPFIYDTHINPNYRKNRVLKSISFSHYLPSDYLSNNKLHSSDSVDHPSHLHHPIIA